MECKLAFKNTERHAQPCALGFHPAFVRGRATRIELNARAYRNADDCTLPAECHETRGTPFDYSKARFLPERTIDATFEGWDGNAHMVDGDGKVIGVASDEAERCVLFAPAKRNFLCLEPVQNATNALNANECYRLGMRVLPIGGKNLLTMRISL